MAAVTGELTGRPGAALSTLGPGVTASATGLAYARLDRAPMIYLSDRHPEAALGFTTHQALDHGAHLGPVVKASLTLAPESASHWIAHAARLALAEPRGPVHLDLPADVADRPALGLRPNPVAPTALVPETALLDEAAAMIRAARRPIVVAGLECRQSEAKWLRAFCEALPAPLLTTYKAKGAIPDPHPLAMGVFTGGVLEEAIVKRADLIIALGLDLVELIPRRWPYSAPVLSLRRTASTDPALAAPGGGTYFTPALEVTGDLALILEELAPRLVRADARADWDVAEVDRLRRRARERARGDRARPGAPPRGPDHAGADAGRGHRHRGRGRAHVPGDGVLACGGARRMPHLERPRHDGVCAARGHRGAARPPRAARRVLHRRRRASHGGLGARDGRAASPAHHHRRLRRRGAVADPGRSRSRRGMSDTAMRHEGPDLAALARAFGLVAFAASDEAGLQRALISALGVPGPTLIAARIDASGYRRMLEIVRGAPAPPSGSTTGG